MTKARIKRTLMALAGMGAAGIAVGFFKRAFFGVDPFQCFCGGINRVIPIWFGTLYMLINAALLVLVFFLKGIISESQRLSICFCLGMPRSSRKSCWPGCLAAWEYRGV